MNRQELLDSLMAERYDNRWWVTPAHGSEAADDELTTARRRRQMEFDYARLNEAEREAK